MKKILAVCLTATLMASALVGCGSEPAPASSVPASSAPASSVAASADTAEPASKSVQDILAAIEAANPIDTPRDLDDFALENDYKMTMGNIQEFAGKVSNTQGDSGTILVIKAAAGKAADVKNELATYQADQINYWGNYAEFADAQASAQEGRIVENGDYVVLVFASLNADYAAIDEAVTAALA